MINNMLQLKRLIVHNYRTLRAVDLELRPLNILIGANGSGKSNLLSLFELFQQAAGGKMGTFIDRLGGFNMLRTFQANALADVGWHFRFEDVAVHNLAENTLQKLDYDIFAVLKNETAYILLSEAAHAQYSQNSDTITLLDARLGGIYSLRSVIQGSSFIDTPKGIDHVTCGELVLRQFQHESDYPELFILRSAIADWTVFRAFDDEALKNIRIPQLLNVVDPLHLNDDGTNLISILHHLREEAKYAEIYAQIIETMCLAFPDIDQLDIELTINGMGILGYRSKDAPEISISAIQMSDGMLRFLGLTLLLLLPEPPPLIAIDTPEIGLHPNLLPILAGLIKQASKRTQIVIATHSAQLLNAESIEPEDVVLVEREDGASKFNRLPTESVNRWLDRYSLGELWVRGTLNALMN
jgi:predicted ATPase